MRPPKGVPRCWHRADRGCSWCRRGKAKPYAEYMPELLEKAAISAVEVWGECHERPKKEREGGSKHRQLEEASEAGSQFGSKHGQRHEPGKHRRQDCHGEGPAPDTQRKGK